jgi:hypothetical protein
VIYHIPDDEDRDGSRNVGFIYIHDTADGPIRLYRDVTDNSTVMCPVAAAVFSGPCVWGPQSVERYYYRQVDRRQEAQTAPNRVPQVVLAPHQREKMFVPRYIRYQNAAGLTPDTGFAHGVPQIVITEHPPCLRHRHLPPKCRRHSAPGHITLLAPDRVPRTPADTCTKQKLSDIRHTK